MHWTDRRTALPRRPLHGERCVHPGSVLRSDLGPHRRGSRLRARHVRGLDRLAHRAGRARPDRADLERVRGPGLPHQPRRQPAADGRCRSRLRQCAQRQAHRRGTRRPRASLPVSIEDTELPTPFGTAKPRLIPIAERRRQDEGGPRRPRRIRCCAIAGRTSALADHRPRRRHRAAARPTRRSASMRCSSSASGRARELDALLGRDHAADHPGRRDARAHRHRTISRSRRARSRCRATSPSPPR